MNKSEYIRRLAQQLSYYEGNHQDILENYDSIIDELTDEGLSMQEIISKLGRPGSLAEDIAEEFELTYTEETKRNISMPQWAKRLLIIVGILILIPSILSLVFGLTRTLISIFIGVLSFFTFGIFSANSLWTVSGLSTGFKTLSTMTALAGIISVIIITYFIIHWSMRLIQYIVQSLRNTGDTK